MADQRLKTIKDHLSKTAPTPSSTTTSTPSTSSSSSTTNTTNNTNKASTMTDYKFQGWMGLDEKSVDGNMKWQEFEPKTFEETDVDIKITHCGICGSDIHTLRSGWSPTSFPVCVGHEIVGIVVRAGDKVENDIKVGDRVGVGAQSGSCLSCDICKDGEENYCKKGVDTYNAKWSDGIKSNGGYGDYARVPSHFAFKIPEKLSSEVAAPMLCAGITVYSPLKRNGVGPGKVAGIVGIGGLGHFGLLFAKALGADKVVAISRYSKKKEEAMKLGADHFIATEEEPDWYKKNSGTIDVIVSTVSSPKMPLANYLRLLKLHGKFVQVGVPEDPIPQFGAFSLIGKNVSILGSKIGPPGEIKEMLDLAAEKNVKTWHMTRPMSEANQAVVDFEKNPPRYRFVLVNEKNLNQVSQS